MELKGSVFKKFDKNNLFQVSCSDVRERFHLFSLLFIVVVQTMKEYGWKEGKEIHIFIFVNMYGVSKKILMLKMLLEINRSENLAVKA